MSRASDSFAQSIQDSENLLAHFNALNSKPPPPQLEVLKRAGLIMAMTAWETYVEDRVLEATFERLRGSQDSTLAEFFLSRLKEDVAKLNNPTSAKTLQLFRDYAGVDVGDRWSWNNHDKEMVRTRLNAYLKLRGDVVHRSRAVEPGPPKAHAVTRHELKRAISFLKCLVQATELALDTAAAQVGPS